MGVDRTVFKTRWEGSGHLAWSTRLDPDRLGPDPPKFRWLIQEPPLDPWTQLWIDDGDPIRAIDLAHAGLSDTLASAVTNEALSADPRFTDLRVLADDD